MDAIILAGGKGKRMESDIPKPLIKTKGKAILSHQIDYLLSSGLIDKIILSVGHKADEIMNFVKQEHDSKKIEFSVETEPLGTAGGLKKALQKSSSDFVLILNCDDITNINLMRLCQLKENIICVAHPRLPFGRIKEHGEYAFFEEKPLLDDWVSCGWYLLDREDFLKILPDNGSLEYDVFPKTNLKVYKHEGFWKPLNTNKDLIEFESIEFPDAFSLK